MQRWFFETHNELNWGKFMVCRFDGEDWAARSVVDEVYHQSLLGGRGWSPEHLMVFDIQTGEGALFKPGGLPRADLRKHQIWVCPMFELFLTWLYDQDLADIGALPPVIQLPGPTAWRGYRREGPDEEARQAVVDETTRPAKLGFPDE